MSLRDVNGTKLWVEDSGPGSTGETLAFSHGLLWDTTLFAPQVAALRDRYRCVAWDHRGQGRSASDHRHCIDMELVWQDAVALLEQLDAGPVHFVGLSMGGFVALRMGARRPDLVRSLVLVETSADPEPMESVGKYRMLTRVSRAFGTGIVKKQVASIMLGKSIRGDRARRGEVAQYANLMAARRDIWRAVNGVIDRAGVAGELARIRTPSLVVVGDEDTATPPAKAERLVAGIAHAKLAVIPRAGHSSTVEEPVAVTAAIESFIAAQRAARN
ncbi:MAG TPA: alpha/beta fold hydrolase [Kofleriaceae bacterium]|jgi:pimeloyl-ACP methyl ester carboxylesterase